MSLTIERELICKHEPCRCPVADGEDFCSDECRDAKDVMECPCTHEHCSLDHEKPNT